MYIYIYIHICRYTSPTSTPHGFPPWPPRPSLGNAGRPRAPCAAPARPGLRRRRGRIQRWEWTAAADVAGPETRRCPPVTVITRVTRVDV